MTQTKQPPENPGRFKPYQIACGMLNWLIQWRRLLAMPLNKLVYRYPANLMGAEPSPRIWR